MTTERKATNSSKNSHIVRTFQFFERKLTEAESNRISVTRELVKASRPIMDTLKNLPCPPHEDLRLPGWLETSAGISIPKEVKTVAAFLNQADDACILKLKEFFNQALKSVGDETPKFRTGGITPYRFNGQVTAFGDNMLVGVMTWEGNGTLVVFSPAQNKIIMRATDHLGPEIKFSSQRKLLVTPCKQRIVTANENEVFVYHVDVKSNTLTRLLKVDFSKLKKEKITSIQLFADQHYIVGCCKGSEGSASSDVFIMNLLDGSYKFYEVDGRIYDVATLIKQGVPKLITAGSLVQIFDVNLAQLEISNFKTLIPKELYQDIDIFCNQLVALPENETLAFEVAGSFVSHDLDYDYALQFFKLNDECAALSSEEMKNFKNRLAKMGKDCITYPALMQLTPDGSIIWVKSVTGKIVHYSKNVESILCDIQNVENVPSQVIGELPYMAFQNQVSPINNFQIFAMNNENNFCIFNVYSMLYKIVENEAASCESLISDQFTLFGVDKVKQPLARKRMSSATALFMENLVSESDDYIILNDLKLSLESNVTMSIHEILHATLKKCKNKAIDTNLLAALKECAYLAPNLNPSTPETFETKQEAPAYNLAGRLWRSEDAGSTTTDVSFSHPRANSTMR